MTSTVLQCWYTALSQLGTLPFLSDEKGTHSYAEFLIALENVDQKICDSCKGTLVIQSDYCVEGVAWLIAALAYGWRVVPIVTSNSSVVDGRVKVAEATHRVSAATGWELDDTVGDGQKNASLSSGVVLFSSGSTGEPKGMCKELDLTLEPTALAVRKQASMGLLLLFDHIGGLNTLLAGVKKGAHLVAPKERKPRIMAELIDRYDIRTLPCSPTFLNMMLLEGVFDDYALSSLRLVTYGTERMPEELLKRLSTRLPKVKFLQTFGTSETGILRTKSLSSSSTFLKIDDPSAEWKVVDGELWIRSRSQIEEYMNHTQPALSDGWFVTGDLVELRADGFFRVIGRKKEVINVGGEKVLPSEVEDLLVQISGIEDCTAYAVPNALTGQSVGVRVVASKDADIAKLKKQIRAMARTKLEGYKIPTKIAFVDAVKHTDRFKKER